jgi:hypothetical protein
MVVKNGDKQLSEPREPLRISDPLKFSESLIGKPVPVDEVNIPRNGAGNAGNVGNARTGRKRKPKKADLVKIQKSFFEHEGRVYEQVYDPEKGISEFVYYDPGFDRAVSTPNVGNIYPVELVPNESSTVGLPENAINFYRQYKNGNDAEADLLIEVEGFIFKYVDLESSFRTFAACYVLLSWLYDRFYSIPYLRLLGDFGTGKSRALDVIGGICYRPINVSGATSAAGIFRVIDRWKGTLILDESDFRYSDETVDIIRILNQGFEKTEPSSG